jgi:hypothetical protein
LKKPEITPITQITPILTALMEIKQEKRRNNN